LIAEQGDPFRPLGRKFGSVHFGSVLTEAELAKASRLFEGRPKSRRLRARNNCRLPKRNDESR
jgi:hypothetical protein